MKKPTKKSIAGAMERLSKASVSPKERLKLLKGINVVIKKTDAKVKKLIVKIKKEADKSK